MYLNESADQKGFILETAHAVKFADVVEKITGEEIAIPESIRGLLSLQKKSIPIKPEYSALKEYLTERS